MVHGSSFLVVDLVPVDFFQILYVNGENICIDIQTERHVQRQADRQTIHRYTRRHSDRHSYQL